MTYLHRYDAMRTTDKDGQSWSKKGACEPIHCAAILLGCKTTENLRTMRDIYYALTNVLDASVSAEELDRVRMLLCTLGDVV